MCTKNRRVVDVSMTRYKRLVCHLKGTFRNLTAIGYFNSSLNPHNHKAWIRTVEELWQNFQDSIVSLVFFFTSP